MRQGSRRTMGPSRYFVDSLNRRQTRRFFCLRGMMAAFPPLAGSPGGVRGTTPGKTVPGEMESAGRTGALTDMRKGDTDIWKPRFHWRSDGSQTGINPPAQPSAPFLSSPQFHLEPTPFPKRGICVNRPRFRGYQMSDSRGCRREFSVHPNLFLTIPESPL